MHKGKIISLVILFLIACNASGQSRHALLIGIGNYPEESGWSAIHGNNDIPIIRANLVRQGFPECQIITLIDSAATKENILSAFAGLVSSLNQGDVVYVHFSGHGQQVTDLDGDEDDGFDESWIPYDAQKKYNKGVYEGECHLIDDELNVILTRLRTRVGARGKIIVVADACHSGSGSRGYSDDGIFVRGTADKFIIPCRKSNIIKKPAPIEWLFIAACRPYQSNYEYRSPDGEYYGVLSYVIANDDSYFDACKYPDLLSSWGRDISDKARYPQNLDKEGQPSRKNSYMF